VIYARKMGRISALLLTVLVLAGCTAAPQGDPTPDATPTPEATTSSAPTAEPGIDADALRAALEAGDALAVGPYFADTVSFGSAGSEGRPDQSRDEAVLSLTTQLQNFGPLDCSPDAAVVETYRTGASADATLANWLPADAVVCLSAQYLFSFVPSGDRIVGYYTFPVGIYG